jgi:hypothetical protein
LRGPIRRVEAGSVRLQECVSKPYTPLCPGKCEMRGVSRCRATRHEFSVSARSGMMLESRATTQAVGDQEIFTRRLGVSTQPDSNRGFISLYPTFMSCRSWMPLSSVPINQDGEHPRTKLRRGVNFIWNLSVRRNVCRQSARGRSKDVLFQ